MMLDFVFQLETAYILSIKNGKILQEKINQEIEPLAAFNN